MKSNIPKKLAVLSVVCLIMTIIVASITVMCVLIGIGKDESILIGIVTMFLIFAFGTFWVSDL
jgi:hypothetical protein